jgi:hypothetical protein
MGGGGGMSFGGGAGGGKGDGYGSSSPSSPAADFTLQMPLSLMDEFMAIYTQADEVAASEGARDDELVYVLNTECSEHEKRNCLGVGCNLVEHVAGKC